LVEGLTTSLHKISHVLKPEKQKGKAQYWAIASYATTDEKYNNG
jgi:hypothetical protein